MTTLAQLESNCAYLVGDPTNSVWTTAELDIWINSAIRDISKHFPRVLTYDISTSLNDRQYDLEDNFIAALSVEYPQGEDPPEYLTQRAYTHPNFWIQDGYYDIIFTKTSDSNEKTQFLISTKPAASETIRIWYNAEHNALSGSSDVTTVLERHEHLIPLYVRWKCWQELALTEGADPDPIKLLSPTQEVNAYRAERAYRKALTICLQTESESKIMPGWNPDKYGSNIY